MAGRFEGVIDTDEGGLFSPEEGLFISLIGAMFAQEADSTNRDVTTLRNILRKVGLEYLKSGQQDYRVAEINKQSLCEAFGRLMRVLDDQPSRYVFAHESLMWFLAARSSSETLFVETGNDKDWPETFESGLGRSRGSWVYSSTTPYSRGT